MRVYTKSDIEHSSGSLSMFYGETAVGKTTSLLLTAPDPILLLQCENRSLERTMDVCMQVRPSLRLNMAMYENFRDTMEYIHNQKDFILSHKTVIVDSATDLMAVKLSHEIQDEAFEARKEEEKKKWLISQSKLTLEGFGSIAAQTLRFTDAMARFAQLGMNVVFTARLDHNPSWAPYLNYAPLLKGKEFGKDFKGFFDLIGYVIPNVSVDEVTQAYSQHYPPLVYFESPNNQFLCKWTGPTPPSGNKFGPFDLEKILTIAKGK